MLKRHLRWLIPLFVGGFLGLAGGFAIGLYLFPFIFPPPAANEQLADADAQTVVARAIFIQADPSDPVHYGQGGASVYRAPDGRLTVRLESDFKVGPGPKYHVYLVDHAAVREADHVTSSTWTDLGRLRAFEGSQNYAVPPGIDLADYQSIVIWCETFGVLIAPATLEDV